jgi:hypothetical protein
VSFSTIGTMVAYEPVQRVAVVNLIDIVGDHEFHEFYSLDARGDLASWTLRANASANGECDRGALTALLRRAVLDACIVPCIE